jgi:hypothetical protein
MCTKQKHMRRAALTKGRARELNVAPVDSGNSQRSTLAEFLRATRVTEQQLRDLGDQAIAKGCCEDTQELRYTLVHSMTSTNRRIVNGHRYVRAGWDSVDGTIYQTDTDTAERYLVVPPWSNNRCAVDAMWSLAICMDLFRTQTDQQDWDQIERMARMPALLRNVMLRNIGSMTSAQRGRMRDVMAGELHRLYPTEFRPAGLWDLAYMLQVCFSTAPQLSFTEVMTTVCCDKKHRIIPQDLRTQRATGIDLSYTIYENGKTGQDAINDYFGLIPYAGEVDPGPCSNGTACLKRPRSQHAIIDRMPPMLMVIHTGGVNSESHINMLAPKAVMYYHHQHGWRQAHYHLKGFAVQVNLNHFTVRWLMTRGDDPTWVEFDSLHSERCREVETWNAGLLAKNKKGQERNHIVAVFFAQDFD